MVSAILYPWGGTRFKYLHTSRTHTHLAVQKSAAGTGRPENDWHATTTTSTRLPLYTGSTPRMTVVTWLSKPRS
eukprot:2499341-Rhodomonas_salina.1